MTATYGCWQVSPKPLPFFLSDLFRRLSLTALVFDDCMENDTWVMWDRHRTGESKGGFDLRNPKPETRNGQLKLASIDETRNRQRKLVSIDETRNPKPTAKVGFNRRNPKPETRNPKPTAKVGFNRRNPKPETRNRQQKWVSIDETRNPKPTAKVGFKRRNPKPETDSESGFQATKPETRNRQRKWVSIDETRNPKPETDSESWFQATKPETDSESGFQSTKPETRNPKPTAKVGFNRRNPKPEIRNRQRKLVSIDETGNPKPETDSNPTFGWLSGSELKITMFKQIHGPSWPIAHAPRLRRWCCGCAWCPNPGYDHQAVHHFYW